MDVCLCCVLRWYHRFSARRAAVGDPVERGPSGRRGGGYTTKNQIIASSVVSFFADTIVEVYVIRPDAVFEFRKPTKLKTTCSLVITVTLNSQKSLKVADSQPRAQERGEKTGPFLCMESAPRKRAAPAGAATVRDAASSLRALHCLTACLSLLCAAHALSASPWLSL